MLSSKEYTGLKTILSRIEDYEIFSVLDTVTKGMVKSHNRTEAIEKILLCTKKPSDLLRRQKITKKILFNYLVGRGDYVLGDWGKQKLVEQCLKIWESSDSYQENDYIEEEIEMINPSVVSTPAISQMGVEFAKWFFQLLNTLNGFGPEHFWPQCTLTAELYTPLEQKEVCISGASDVATFLANLIIIDKYYFGANDSNDSVDLQLEQHGLIKICVRGILYRQSNCIGLFDSAFGLVKNPDCQDTYKIQVTTMKLQVNASPHGTYLVNNQMSVCQT